MYLRRALPWLLLLTACDDDLTTSEAPPDAGIVDASVVDASLDEPVVAAPLDARVDLIVDPIDASLPTPDASHEAGVKPDAAVLDCSKLGLTYDNYGAEFLYLWCLSCHAKQEPTFTTPEDVRLWAPAMRVDTLDTRSMPPSGNANYLRDNQREEFARWLDCGAP